MDPVAELERRGGIARTVTLREAGVSTYALRRAKESGAVLSIRRGWVAVPTADPAVREAIARGMLLSCVSVAELMGLWVPQRSPLHVVARPHATTVKTPAHVTVHWSRPVVPRDPDVTVDELPNALALVAQCQPFETALVIWESALNKGLVDSAFLRGLPLPPAARRVLDVAHPFSDSGLETIFMNRFRWLRVPMQPQAWVCGRRVDLLIGARLVVQIDGATHTGAQRTRDIDHDAQLMLRGYYVLRFSYEQIMQRWHEVQAVVMHAVALDCHLA